MKIQNVLKVFLLSAASIAFANCKTSQPVENINAPVAEIVKADAPFASAEPEKYEVEIVQTSSMGVEKFFAARDGAKWRTDSAYGEPNQITSIHTDKEYVFSYATKIYAEYPIAHGFDEREDTINAMTRGLLNNKEKGAYEKVGPDNGLTKYRLAGEPGKNIETLIYVDEKIGLPVKKEVFKTDGGQRTLDYSVQLSNFKPAADPNSFTVLKGFKQVSIDDMKKALTGVK